MKKIFFLSVMLLCMIFSFAQHVPQGMKYQAVARNLAGNVLANQSITLKINLLTQDNTKTTIYYSETHAVTTNQVGLFTLTIGEGKIEKGTFASIPWSTADVWMQVAIKDKGQNDFTTISNSKLLAVPYAFHAGTASQLIGSSLLGGNGVGSTAAITGIPAQVWSLKGNSGVDPTTDRLGTTDAADLVLITNNIERLRILANGDVRVQGVIQERNTTQSTSITNGAVIVDGGVGIAKNLNVGGDFKVNGSTSIKNLATTNLYVKGDSTGFIATIENTNSEDGDGLKIKLGKVHPLWNGTTYDTITNPVIDAFQPQIDLIKGWVSSGKTVQGSDILTLFSSTGELIGGALCQLTNYITPKLNSSLGLPLNLATPINTALKLPWKIDSVINSALNLPYNLASPINSGLGLPYKIADATVIPGLPDLIIPGIPAGSLTIPGIPTNALTIPAIPQIDCSGLPQIKIPVIKTESVTNSLTKNNEFIKFVDKDDRQVGVIRSQSIANFKDDHFSQAYVFHLVSAVGGIDIARGFLSILSELNQLATDYNNLGVEYISGHGDYAEWMERSDNQEEISAGDIVAVKGGKITKNLAGAEQIMAVSTAPIVNANMPQQDKVALGNSIAFMGQIPVKIIGEVTTGDFIVAKGNIAGYGVAIKSSNMTAEDFRLVVGRAWETINGDGPKMVNTLVGVQNNDFLKIIERYQQKFESAEERLNAIEKRLNSISSADKKVSKK